MPVVTECQGGLIQVRNVFEERTSKSKYRTFTAGRGISGSGCWPYMYNFPLQDFETSKHVNGAGTAFRLLTRPHLLHQHRTTRCSLVVLRELRPIASRYSPNIEVDSEFVLHLRAFFKHGSEISSTATSSSHRSSQATPRPQLHASASSSSQLPRTHHDDLKIIARGAHHGWRSLYVF